MTTERLSQGIFRFLRTVSCAMDAGDVFTHGRPYRCSKYALRIGRHFDFSESDLVQLESAALLQDLGKKMIRTGLLHKTGTFNEKERKQVQTHAHACYELLSGVPFLSASADLVLAQHERPDGTGYPAGLQADEIPKGSQILSVVSAFDAMTSDRPYRPGLEPEAAYVELRRCSGTMFFADVVEALIELHQTGELFTELDRDELKTYLGEDVSSCRALRGWLEKEGILSSTTIGEQDSGIEMHRDPFRDHAA